MLAIKTWAETNMDNVQAARDRFDNAAAAGHRRPGGIGQRESNAGEVICVACCGGECARVEVGADVAGARNEFAGLDKDRAGAAAGIEHGHPRFDPGEPGHGPGHRRLQGAPD